MFKGIWALLSLSFIFPWNRKPWLDNFMFIVTLECAICEYEHTSLKIISRGPNNGSTCIWEKYFIIVWGECDTLLKQMELQFSSFSLISVRDSAKNIKKSQRNKNLEASCNLLKQLNSHDQSNFSTRNNCLSARDGLGMSISPCRRSW